MRNEIKDVLTTLKIEAKEERKQKGRNILIIIFLAVIFYLIPYFNPQLNGLYILCFLLILFGGFYMVFIGFPSLIFPLKSTSRAFKKIVNAIEILENSKNRIAYKEAFNCLNRAYKILDDCKIMKK
jgi:hypothetical protein